MKPAISYGLVGNYSGQYIVKITSKDRHYWYGRGLDDRRTSGSNRDLMAEFGDLVYANECLHLLKQAQEDTRYLFDAARDAQLAANHARQKAIDEVIASCKVLGGPNVPTR